MNKIFKNSLYVTGSYFLDKLLNAVAFIFIARYLGEDDFGILSIALAISGVIVFFSDFGVTNSLIREINKEDADIPLILGSYVRVRVVLAALCTLLVFLIVYIFYSDRDYKYIIFILTLFTLIGSTLQSITRGYFQAIQEMQYAALINVIGGLLSSFSLFLSIMFLLPVEQVAVLLGIARITSGLFSIKILKNKIIPKFGWDRKILDGISSFSLGGILVAIIPQLGIIILERVADIKEVGIFSLSYRIPVLLYSVPALFSAGFYPRLFQLANNRDYKRHEELSTLEIYIMTTIAICISFPFLLFPDLFMNLFFGKNLMNDHALVLFILMWIVILQSINYPLGDFLTTRGFQNVRNRCLTLSIIVASFCFYTLGKVYGALGAAISALILELVLLIALLISSKKYSLLIKGAMRNIVVLIFMLSVLKSISINTHPFLISIVVVPVFIMFSFLLHYQVRSILYEQILKYYKISIFFKSKGVK